MRRRRMTYSAPINPTSSSASTLGGAVATIGTANRQAINTPVNFFASMIPQSFLFGCASHAHPAPGLQASRHAPKSLFSGGGVLEASDFVSWDDKRSRDYRLAVSAPQDFARTSAR
jgi:hypothetical protein